MRFILLYINYILNKLRLYGRVKFKGFTVIFSSSKSKIQWGKDITINSDFLSNLFGLFQRTIIIAINGGQITIGNNCGISGSTIYSVNKISIGKNVLIGANCKIVDSDFHPVNYKERLADPNINIASAPIKINENVFIGAGSIILKGTEIGKNCTIGAGSIVKGKFPENCVIAGNPAKVIKHCIE